MTFVVADVIGNGVGLVKSMCPFATLLKEQEINYGAVCSGQSRNDIDDGQELIRYEREVNELEMVMVYER